MDRARVGLACKKWPSNLMCGPGSPAMGVCNNQERPVGNSTLSPLIASADREGWREKEGVGGKGAERSAHVSLFSLPSHASSLIIPISRHSHLSLSLLLHAYPSTQSLPRLKKKVVAVTALRIETKPHMCAPTCCSSPSNKPIIDAVGCTQQQHMQLAR